MASPVAIATVERPQSVQHAISEPNTPRAPQHLSAPISSPPAPAGREFQWTPSKSEALGPAAVKLTKREPRLWDRAPHLPAAQDSRFKTVWRRYMLRPRAATAAPALPAITAPALVGPQEKTPERPVKKMRVQHELFYDAMGHVDHAVVTKWQRRRSSLPRKESSRTNPAVDGMSMAYAAENVLFRAAESNRRSSLPPSLSDIQHSRSVSEPLITFQDNSSHPPGDKDSLIENHGPDCKDVVLDNVTDVRSNDQESAEVDSQPMEAEPVEVATDGPDMGASEDLPSMDAIPIASKEDSCVTRDSVLEPSTAIDSEETHVDDPPQLSNSTPTKSPIPIPLSPVLTRDLTAHELSPADNSLPLAENESLDDCHDDSTTQAQADLASSPSSDCDNETMIVTATANHILPECAQEDACNAPVVVHLFPESPLVDTAILDTIEDRLEPTEPLSPTTSVGTPTKFPSQPELDPPTPILEDATATLTFTTMNQLEDDKAFLRSFLDRAAASKVVKVQIAPEGESGDKSICSRRESLQNRRDSDAVRQALASPRQPLEQKDGNVFSPPAVSQQEYVHPKSDVPSIADDLVLPPIDELLKKPGRTSPRRSGRTRTTRSTISGPSKERTQISVRLNEGNDTINLTKSEAQVTAILTRRNTRKNKGAALSVPDRLVKYRADVEVLGTGGTTPDPNGPSKKTKRVEWTATICFLDQNTGQRGVEPLLDGSSNSDDEPHPPDSVPAVPPSRSTRITRSSTPKYRKLRSLGAPAGNGTAAKVTLSSTLLPDELAEDAAAPAAETPRPAAEQKKRVEAGGSSAATASVAASKSRAGQQRSRIPHSRKPLSLNPSVRSVAAAVREDTLRLFGPGGAAGAAAAAAKVQVPASLLPVTGGRVAGAKKVVRTGES